MTARILVLIEFPGTTCSAETVRAFEILGARARIARDVPRGRIDAIVLPGGFAFADAPRPGAVAARTPTIRAVARAAARGVPILGICNGFQILLAAGLLPGRVEENESGRFFCGWETYSWRGRKVRLPVAHRFGRYVPGEAEAEGAEVLLRAGSEIAGIARGRVWGVMPHPERAVEKEQGGTDGRRILAAFLQAGDRPAS